MPILHAEQNILVFHGHDRHHRHLSVGLRRGDDHLGGSTQRVKQLFQPSFFLAGYWSKSKLHPWLRM